MGPEICAEISSTVNDSQLLSKLYFQNSNSTHVSDITNLKTTNFDKIKPKNEQQKREAETRRLWQNADAVCFDVDSTVCQV